MAKKRLDELLVDKGLAENRSKAKALVMAGAVICNGQKVTKAGEAVPDDAAITVKGPEHPYVSRGGLKLEKAVREWGLVVDGLRALDVGASTGGFTDLLLQNGAVAVTALDVGHGQLDWKLRSDPRVRTLEKFNARDISPHTLEEEYDAAVIDVSFISLKLVLGPVKSVLKPGGFVVALIKPQFEAGKKEADKGGGVIRDEAVRLATVEEIKTFAASVGYRVDGVAESPITGPKGNVEYLLLLYNL